MHTHELPVRPLTAGEVLDAAVAVLRRRPWRLLGYALALAAAEQVLLYLLLRGQLRDVHNYFTFHGDAFDALSRIVGLAVGTEGFIFVLLGAVASRRAYGMLLRGAGVAAPAPVRPRPVAALVTAVLVGAGATVTFVFGALPWVFWFAFTGVAAPALVVDSGRISPWRAVARSMRLVGGANLRPGGLRLLGYLPWLVLRLLVGFAGTDTLTALTGTLTPGWTALLAGVIWALIDTVAYAAIACLDAVIYLEARMRREGLDIALSRAAARPTPVVTR